QRLYLFWSANADKGPAGRLLGASQATRVEEMAGQAPQAIAALRCSEFDAAPVVRPSPQRPGLRAREFTGLVQAPWEERSYTGLMRAIRPEAADAGMLAVTTEAPRPDHDEWVAAAPPDGEASAAGEQPVRHGFPAGARAGTALHAV